MRTRYSRMRQVRILRGLTQKKLGLLAGLPEKSAETQISHYESGRRFANENTFQSIADTLGVPTYSLGLLSIDTCYDVINLLFSLEDAYGLTIEVINGKPFLKFPDSLEHPINNDLIKWNEMREKVINKELSLDEYNEWRYTYKNEYRLSEEESKEEEEGIEKMLFEMAVEDFDDF